MGKTVSLRMTDEEVAKLDALRSRVEARIGGKVAGLTVTYRTVILEALNALERYENDLERKRK